MQVNNELLSYTLKKNIAASVNAAAPAVAESAKTASISSETEIDTLSINGETIEASGVMTDEEYAKAVSALKNKAAASSELKTTLTLEDLQSEEYKQRISDIKTAIYKYNNPGGKWIQAAEDTSTYTFLDDTTFKGTDELVSWLKGTNNWDNEKDGLPLSNLVKLTQNDNLEDANRDFFGQLNRTFNNHVDSDGNLFTNTKLNLDDDCTIISYYELQNFFNDIQSMEAMSDLVQQYSNQLQAEYDELDLQGKLDFAIVKTREYLEAMGMDSQIQALDRLTNEGEDLFNQYHIGQISLADLNEGCNVATEGMTLGAYNYMAYYGSYNNYDTKTWAGDEDFVDYTKNKYNIYENVDLGITLDYRLADNSYDSNALDYGYGKWYDMVSTLVHELTHATAYQYYDEDGDGTITNAGVEQLIKLGAVKDWAEWNSMTLEQQEYLAYTAWGEYRAYQVDSDYSDSIAGDIFDTDIPEVGSGEKEKENIDKHIKDEYNDADYTEAVPNWKWWSYA